MLEIETVNIELLSYPGSQQSAVFGLMDLFQTANKLHEVATQKGVKQHLQVDIVETLEDRKQQLSVIIVPPSLTGDPAPHGNVYAKPLKQLHRQGTLVCSICAGAFLLAEAELLGGREVTTHWALAETFRERYPDIKLSIEKLIIDDGDIITAGGVMAWVDLGLKLVDRYLGSVTMLATARYMLVDPGEREQSFYSVFSPSLAHGDEAILIVQHWLQKNYAGSITVIDMAAYANLTKRTFIRRFQQATSLNPSEYLQHLRIGQARRLMESSKLSIDAIAWEVGYSDASGFRRIFQKVMGLTLREYRYRFTAREDVSPSSSSSEKSPPSSP